MRPLKLTVFLLLPFLIKSRPAYCQPAIAITLTEKNAPLQKVLDDIHEKTGYTYAGFGDWPSVSRPVSFSVTNASIDEVLSLCFRDQPLIYEVNTVDRTISIRVRPKEDREVHGWVFDENREPMARVSIHVVGEGDAMSGDNGEFKVWVHYAGVHLVFSMVGYERKEVALPEPGRDLQVELASHVGTLEVVTVHTGYQDQRKLNTTGSFDVVDNDLLNRHVAPNILDHIDGVTSGVLFNKNIASGVNQSTISVRGRSTIFGNPNPLIILDNFPYNGDINNINPADVENITVLKDAAAAAIWGAFAGNGVIVITTKKAKAGQGQRISFTTSQTGSQKVNLYYPQVLSSSDYIDIEQYLFRQGWYDGYFTSPLYPALTPAVEIFGQRSRGMITADDSARQINALKKIDTRKDVDRYFYRRGLNSRYSLSFSGGNEKDQYYLSAGYDRNLTFLTHDDYDRVTLLGNNSYTLVPKKLELSTNLIFAGSTTYLNNSGNYGINYPYAKLADAQRNPLPVAYGLRLPYVDTAGGGKLLDWHYRPLDELRNANNVVHLNDYRINLGLRYCIRKGLEARAYYQYSKTDSNFVQYFSLKTYRARNLINSFAQDSAGIFNFPVPRGGILNENLSAISGNNVRLLLSYNDSLFRNGWLSLMTGSEVRDIEGTGRVNWLYGYNPELGSSIPVDYLHSYPNYTNDQPMQLPYQDTRTGSAERYISYYANGSYLYRGRYMLSASVRRDESNLFGVNANQKGVPLWSVGGAWELSKEQFYRWSSMPFLRLRVTNGYNGNIDRNVSAYTTAVINGGLNPYNNINASIVNPANPSLRWERVQIFNAGIDFATKENRLSGTIEYFIKSGIDLIGESPLDPTTGFSTFTGNTANMINHGLDMTLQGNINIGSVRWNAVLLFSFARDRVTRYLAKQGTVRDYMSVGTINPLKGRPLYSIFALPWKGLSAQTGDPQGLFQGKMSTDYANILGSDILSNMIYKGAANPTLFGSWRNTFYRKQWELSFNVIYKFGYVFRRSSIFYYNVFIQASPGHPDYERRWQTAGDEKRTNVPSLVLSTDPNRDDFYRNSEALIERGDNVRLQDLQLGYTLGRPTHPNLPVQAIKFYLYANNIGILWKANHAGIDPDYVQTLSPPKTLAVGVKIDY
ncbi:MAG TPA: SusC/RagA family TonB-linked outer membrane protein [Puia sp.]|uniref:SusC/RagA family TonB-linked outer membrane protein n=1 Tax=Puia sp. TaxID=2045100 RepID=UPI002CE1CAB4|nr:SusC/RagA family TonB-linked outer membrane protein [Puia sp.]HVU95759.1 SusC/RagA family TonB-linked outer membrane protein [Puia sp.]